MPRFIPRLLVACLCLVLIVLAGCDGTEDDEQAARLRVIHADAATSDASVYVDFDLLARDLTFGDASTYVAWDPGLSLIEVRAEQNGLEVPIISRDVLIEADRDYTILVTGTTDASSIIVLEDDRSTIAFMRARLRVVNGAAHTGAVDVRVTPDGEETSALVLPNLAFGAASDHVTINEGPYDFTVDAVDESDSIGLEDEMIEERRLYLFVVANTGTGNALTHLLVADG